MSGLKNHFATASSSWGLNTSSNRRITALKFPGDAKLLKWLKKLNLWFKKKKKRIV